jgi:hypothetical protein
LICEYRNCVELARLNVSYGGSRIPAVGYCRAHARLVARMFYVDSAKLVCRDSNPPRKEPEAPFRLSRNTLSQKQRAALVKQTLDVVPV